MPYALVRAAAKTKKWCLAARGPATPQCWGRVAARSWWQLGWGNFCGAARKGAARVRSSPRLDDRLPEDWQ